MSILRLSFAGSAAVQPLACASYLDFNSTDAGVPEKWDHFHASTRAGLAFVSRLSRAFELSGEASVAYTQSRYPDLVDATVGYPALLGHAFAALAYHALEELGIVYQLDPTNPFVEVHGSTTILHSIPLPRDTLTKLTSDCDDLTALYTTMLESVGIEAAFIPRPGHIDVAVNTGAHASDYAQVRRDRRQTIIVDEWHAMDENPEKRGLDLVCEAQSRYRPVGQRQTDLALQCGDMIRFAAGFV